MSHALHAHTPHIRAADGRGLPLIAVAYRRTPSEDEPVPLPTTMTWNDAAQLTTQRDPRLSAPNLTTVYSLSGQALLTNSVDAGWRLALLGEAGQVIEGWDGRGSHRQTAYDELLRPIAISEESNADPVGAKLARESDSPVIIERFTYGGPDATVHNQCNQLTRHDDPAGTLRWPDYNLLGSPVSEVRRFLLEPDMPDWPLPEAERDELLEAAECASGWSFNALGETLEQADAMGNSQRFAQTVAGQLKSVVLTLVENEQTETLVSEMHYNAFDQVEQETA
ncbi:toxin, partial [Pseudomonas sp. Pseusp122]